MRLGQLARKYNLSQEQVITFLDKTNPGMGPYHNNTKLSDQVEDQIARHFNKSLADTELEPEPATPDEMGQAETPEDLVKPEEPAKSDIDSPSEVELESQIQSELDPFLPAVEEPEVAPAEEEPELMPEVEPKAIETDKLIELLESDDEDVDLSDITLIKAPKKELEGLKVVGKIDLPEPKPKTKEQPKDDDNNRKPPKPRRRHELSPEEKEKRRLRAKKKQEDYQARQERKRQEEEAKQLKARKKAHYEKKISPTKVTKAKTKTADQVPTEIVIEEVASQTPPKTALGRFWAWFWHGR